MSTEMVVLLGSGAQDVHLDFHTPPELCDHALIRAVEFMYFVVACTPGNSSPTVGHSGPSCCCVLSYKFSIGQVLFIPNMLISFSFFISFLKMNIKRAIPDRNKSKSDGLHMQKSPPSKEMSHVTGHKAKLSTPPTVC